MASFNWPVVSASVSQGPLQFTKDGVTVEVQEDTSTPANTVPLPVKVLDETGNVPDFATEATLQTLGTEATLQAVATELTLQAVAGIALGIETAVESLDGKTTAVDTDNVTVVASALPTGAATESKQDAQSVLVGAVNETAPGSDTASSGLNGRLQRIAQRVTSLIALMPASLGQKAMSGSLAVTVASDQSKFPVALAPPAAVTTKQAAISVGTSAIRLTTDGSAPSSTRVLLAATPDPTSSAQFFVGSSSVTSSGSTRGIPLAPGQTASFDNDAGDYYIISDTAGQTVFVLEQE